MTNLQELNKYIKLRDDINNYYENNIVKSSITIEMVNELLERNNKLIKIHQELLLPRINTIKEQIDNINTYKTSIALLFTDNTYQTVRSDITRENLNQAETNFGLTETGKKVCLELNRLGMLLDVSHLGDKSFYDAIEFYKGPIIASHSNARAINPSVRNLTDDMIRIISKSGGVIGLNLCENFVTKTGDYLNDLVLHLNHIKAVGGIDVVSLGSDFDGIQTPPLITDCTKWNILFDRLSKEGWTDEEIEKLSCKNFERVLKMFK